AATAAASTGMGVHLARALGLARDAGPELAAAAAAASSASGHRPRFVWEFDLAQANAMALPWLQGVLVTGRLVRATAAEAPAAGGVAAVLRHEIGHLREPRAVRIARLAMPVAACWTLVMAPVMSGGSLFSGAFLGWLGVMLAAVVLFRRMGRRMEHRADSE